MALSIIIPQYFVPHSAVKLGRFITNIRHPHQSYHDPPHANEPTPTVTFQEEFTGLNRKSGDAGFSSALTALMSAGFSKRTKTQVKVTAECVKTYTLDNSDDWFAQAMDLLPTKTWIERSVDRGYDIYMIVGFHAITNARIAHERVDGTESYGKINAPASLSLAAVAAIAPLGEIINPSAGVVSRGLDRVDGSFLAPGEQVCAFQYRKVQHRWFSSKTADSSRLSKTPRWSSVERGRDESDGEDDIIEVEAVPLVQQHLGEEVDDVSVPGGKLLLISAD